MLALSVVMKNWPDDKVARTNPAAPAGARRSALGARRRLPRRSPIHPDRRRGERRPNERTKRTNERTRSHRIVDRQGKPSRRCSRVRGVDVAAPSVLPLYETPHADHDGEIAARADEGD